MTNSPAWSLKKKISAGGIVCAVNVGGRNLDVVGTLARLRVDAVLIDCERTGIGLDAAGDLIRAARAHSIPSIVRSWSKQAEVLVQYLDCGADGLIVPRVESALEVEEILRVVNYACGAEAAGKLVVPQIETSQAVRNVAALGTVTQVDAYLVGPNDLSYDMTGSRGNATPAVHDAIDLVCQQLSAAGRRFGMPCPSGELPRFVRRGATFAYHHVDWLLQQALGDLHKLLCSAHA